MPLPLRAPQRRSSSRRLSGCDTNTRTPESDPAALHCQAESAACVKLAFLDVIEAAVVSNAVKKLSKIGVNQALADEDYDASWISAQELAQYKPIHTTSFDEHDDETRYFGAIIIIEDKLNAKTLVLDGNHRYNTVLSQYPNMQVFRIIIQGFLP